jgi:hypothetical protein
MHTDGAYRIYDNSWLNEKLCVSSTGMNITIASNAHPALGEVVAYPSIQFGPFYGIKDPLSGLPRPVRHFGRMMLHVSSRGHTTGFWLSDVDAWFHPGPSTAAHGTFELVIVTRSSGPTPGNWPRVRIRGVWYRWNEWVTCQRDAHGQCTQLTWPLLIFRRMHQSTVARVPFGSFVLRAVRWGFLPRSAWLGDVAFGTELWSGGRGLTDSMTVYR